MATAVWADQSLQSSIFCVFLICRQHHKFWNPFFIKIWKLFFMKYQHDNSVQCTFHSVHSTCDIFAQPGCCWNAFKHLPVQQNSNCTWSAACVCIPGICHYSKWQDVSIFTRISLTYVSKNLLEDCLVFNSVNNCKIMLFYPF